MKRRATKPMERRSSVVDKRRANNTKKPKNTGHVARVADNNPMAKDSESNWP